MLNDKGRDSREGTVRSVVEELYWLVLDDGESSRNGNAIHKSTY